MGCSSTITPSYQVLIDGAKLYHILVVKRSKVPKNELMNMFDKSLRTIDYYIASLNIALLELYQSCQIKCIDNIVMCVDDF